MYFVVVTGSKWDISLCDMGKVDAVVEFLNCNKSIFFSVARLGRL